MESPWQPFCGPRCKDADLGRWLRGDYRIPAEPSPAVEDESPRASDADEREPGT
jgi:endogenous inhibitor of DNA gyrase (YacG/DUF329 family)